MHKQDGTEDAGKLGQKYDAAWTRQCVRSGIIPEGLKETRYTITRQSLDEAIERIREGR